MSPRSTPGRSNATRPAPASSGCSQPTARGSSWPEPTPRQPKSQNLCDEVLVPRHSEFDWLNEAGTIL
ncbi:hypothetical protein SBBP1_790001 [Burkholderiales bacterium]|nr:hypothetical protein SBBP1_790001 [Burkholderiales bacterium]